MFKLTSMTSRAGKMPMFDNVLKKASLFWGCNVCENAQNSFRKFTCRKKENKAQSTVGHNRMNEEIRGKWTQVVITNSCLLSSSVASSVSCAKRSVRNFSSSFHQNGAEYVEINSWYPGFKSSSPVNLWVVRLTKERFPPMFNLVLCQFQVTNWFTQHCSISMDTATHKHRWVDTVQKQWSHDQKRRVDKLELDETQSALEASLYEEL